jgi:hypothetical protein
MGTEVIKQIFNVQLVEDSQDLGSGRLPGEGGGSFFAHGNQSDRKCSSRIIFWREEAMD